MEWQHIVGFYHVARLGSFTKAAEATFRTQSALSQQVKSLEEELGCVLVERIGRRRLLLTPAGETFYRFARDVLEKREALGQSLQELEGIQRGTLTIAAPFTTLYHVLPEYVTAYLNDFAHVQLTILDRPQKTVIELLKNGDADFGFVLKSALPKELRGYPWKTVEPVLMVPIGHPLVEQSPVTMEQIAQYPLILPPAGAAPLGLFNVKQQLQRLGLSYRVIMESSNVELSSLYVEMGLGVSFATVIKELPVLERRRLTFLPLDHYFESDNVMVAVRKGRTLLPYKSAFLNLLLQDASEVVPMQQRSHSEISR
jgi:DNA-binding transcriptional LysR family regulator